MKKNVKRLGKSALALFLAGVLAFTPAGKFLKIRPDIIKVLEENTEHFWT